MTQPRTPASVVRGPAEFPCAVGLLAYSAELHPIGEQRQPVDGGGGPNGPPKSNLEPPAAPWGEADAFPLGHTTAGRPLPPEPDS